MPRSFQDPMLARFAHVQRAQATFVYSLRDGGKVAYNPEPGGEVKAVNAPTYAALKVLYELFVSLDLDVYNAERDKNGQQPLRRIEAVIDEAPLHMPAYLDEIGPNGYPLEVTVGAFQFACRFFRASIKAASNGGRGPRPKGKPLTDTPITASKPAEPKPVVSGAKRRPRRGKRRPQAVVAAS